MYERNIKSVGNLGKNKSRTGEGAAWEEIPGQAGNDGGLSGMTEWLGYSI